MPSSQWIEAKFQANGCSLTIGEVTRSGGNFYDFYNKDNEFDDVGRIKGTRIPDGGVAYVCGRGSTFKGTTASVTLYDGDTKVGTLSWDCPVSGDNTCDWRSDSQEYQVHRQGGNRNGAVGSVNIAVTRTVQDNVVPDKVGRFDSWVLDHRPAVNNDASSRREQNKAVLYTLRNRYARTTTEQHLFVAVHGVGSDFNALKGYVGQLDSVLAEFGLANGKSRPAGVSDIAVLGVNWPSQDMLGMIRSAVTPGERMPAQDEAEHHLAPMLNALCADRNVVLHLIGHSMGSQVLMYLLPALAPTVRVGSMMFLQGFAPSSGFAPRGTELHGDQLTGALEGIATRQMRPVTTVLDKMKVKFSIVDFDPSEYLRSNYMRPAVAGVVNASLKITPFADHLGKLHGPLMATTTQQLWNDFQVGGADLSFYAASGTLGVRGFYQGDTVPVHHVHEDRVCGGSKSYDKRGRVVVNFAVGDHITDHDDFSNRTIAFSQLRTMDWLAADVNSGITPTAGTPTPDRWMDESWERIRSRPLSAICLPGSHDAGLSVVNGTRLPDEATVVTALEQVVETGLTKLIEEPFLVRCLKARVKGLLVPTGLRMLSSHLPSLTLTQTRSIGGQLAQGCRYFDLRPTIGSDKRYYLGHGEHISFKMPVSGQEINLGFIGALGQRLDDALDEVARFASDPAHRHELVILKISHCANWSDLANRSFNAGETASLFQTLRTRLGNALIRNPTPDQRLDRMPLEQLLSGHGTVLCLLEQKLFSDGNPRGDGLYAYAEYGYEHGAVTGPGSPQSYVLFDQYANRRNSAAVIDDQRQKLAAFGRSGKDGVFLLSWTTTLPPSPAMLDMRSILDVARPHNDALVPALQAWIRRGELTTANRPGIIYVDDYGAHILPAVQMLNNL